MITEDFDRATLANMHEALDRASKRFPVRLGDYGVVRIIQLRSMRTRYRKARPESELERWINFPELRRPGWRAMRKHIQESIPASVLSLPTQER
jgi:hypothetical protein